MATRKKLIPDLNPDVGQPATLTAQTQPQRGKTHIDGSELVPNLGDHEHAHGIARSYKFWVGVTPSCPREYIDLAGINFPKVNENLVADPMRTGNKRRVPVIGSIVDLDERKIQKMREKLKRTVIRFLDDGGQAEEPGTGQNVGDNHQRPRRGQIITIPTDAEVEERRRRGKPTQEYRPHPNDVPAARYMFAQLCDDQTKGSRGEYYPDTLETTGIWWPDDL
jgi:hypothetical protein